MADTPKVQTQPLDRDQLRRLAGTDFRTLKFFENLGKDVGETLPEATLAAAAAAEGAQDTADTAVADAANAQGTANGAQADASSALGQISGLRTPQYVVLTVSAELSNERVLTAGGNISITDGGAGGAVTVQVQANPAFVDSLSATLIEVGDGKLGFFGAAPVLQPTTSAASAAFVAGVGTPVFDTSTFGGYTIGQIVTALKALGILA